MLQSLLTRFQHQKEYVPDAGRFYHWSDPLHWYFSIRWNSNLPFIKSALQGCWDSITPCWNFDFDTACWISLVLTK